MGMAAPILAHVLPPAASVTRRVLINVGSECPASARFFFGGALLRPVLGICADTLVAAAFAGVGSWELTDRPTLLPQGYDAGNDTAEPGQPRCWSASSRRSQCRSRTRWRAQECSTCRPATPSCRQP